MKFIGIIPARYASTRFPGKPLADICGKKMIERVCDQAVKALDEVWVATDDQRIFEAVENFGGNVVMTLESHRSGTDRCAEAINKVQQMTGMQYDVVINIQGDEPFIQPDQIRAIKKCFQDEPETQIATLIQPILKNEDIFRSDMVKVLLDKKSNAIYFSRSAIPYVTNTNQSDWLKSYPFYGHIGLYGYQTTVLNQLTKLPEGLLEKAESLEQLRWIENGYAIKTGLTDSDSFGIDTPEDLQKAIEDGIEKYFVAR